MNDEIVWTVDKFSDRVKQKPLKKVKATEARAIHPDFVDHTFQTEEEAYRFMDVRATKLVAAAIDDLTRLRNRQKKCAGWLKDRSAKKAGER